MPDLSLDMDAALKGSHSIPRAGGKILGKTTSKILMLDIERVKGEATVRLPEGNLTGSFWDLGSWKDRIGRRIDPEEVTLWPRTVLVCWEDYFTGEKFSVAEWESDQENMWTDVWHALDEADIIVGHNIDRFDMPKIHGSFAENGWAEPRPYKTVDTYKAARKLGYESNTLDALTKRFGITSKSDRYDHELALMALGGNARAQRALTNYCHGDNTAAKGLFDHLRPRIKNHPVLKGLAWEKDVATHCVYCASSSVDKVPGDRQAQVLTYPMYRCADCGGLFETTSPNGRVGVVRGTGR